MNEGIQSILIGTMPLCFLLIIAIFITYIKGPILFSENKKKKITYWLLIAIAWHSLHFTEEFISGFYQRFPELISLAEWPPSFFICFNLGWIAIWCISIIGMWNGQRIAMIAIYFLALASLVNGVAHPIFSILTGGYFPGLWTSPLAGVIGWCLWKELK